MSTRSWDIPPHIGDMPGLRTATAGGCTALPTMPDGTPIRGTTEDIGTLGITIHTGTEVIMAQPIGAGGMTRGTVTVRGEIRGTAAIIIGTITTTTIHSTMFRPTDIAGLRYIMAQEAQPADSQAVRHHR